MKCFRMDDATLIGCFKWRLLCHKLTGVCCAVLILQLHAPWSKAAAHNMHAADQ